MAVKTLFLKSEKMNKVWQDLEKSLTPILMKIDITKLNHTQLQLFNWLQKIHMPNIWVAWQGICMVDFADNFYKLNQQKIDEKLLKLLMRVKFSGLETLWHGIAPVASEDFHTFGQLIRPWCENGNFSVFINAISDKNSSLFSYLSKYFTKNANIPTILTAMRLGVLENYDSCFIMTEPKTAIKELKKFLKTNTDAKKLKLNHLCFQEPLQNTINEKLPIKTNLQL